MMAKAGVSAVVVAVEAVTRDGARVVLARSFFPRSLISYP